MLWLCERSFIILAFVGILPRIFQAANAVDILREMNVPLEDVVMNRFFFAGCSVIVVPALVYHRLAILNFLNHPMMVNVFIHLNAFLTLMAMLDIPSSGALAHRLHTMEQDWMVQRGVSATLSKPLSSRLILTPDGFNSLYEASRRVHTREKRGWVQVALQFNTDEKILYKLSDEIFVGSAGFMTELQKWCSSDGAAHSLGSIIPVCEEFLAGSIEAILTAPGGAKTPRLPGNVFLASRDREYNYLGKSFYELSGNRDVKNDKKRRYRPLEEILVVTIDFKRGVQVWFRCRRVSGVHTCKKFLREPLLVKEGGKSNKQAIVLLEEA